MLDFNPEVPLTVGLEEHYVQSLLQSTRKNVLFAQGIEGVCCESCSYVHVRWDVSELFQC